MVEERDVPTVDYKTTNDYMKRIVFLILAMLTAIASASAQTRANGDDGAVQSRFQGVASLGFHAVPGYPILSPYASISFGERIKERAYIGAGLGLFLPIGPWYKNDGDISYRNKLTLEMALPAFYMEGDVYWGGWNDWKPYATATLGYATLAGFAKVGIGTDYKDFTMQVGYSPMFFIYKDGSEYNHGLYIDFGYRFNSVKYDRERYGRRHADETDTSYRPVWFQGLVGGGVHASIPNTMINPYIDLMLGVKIKEKYFVGVGVEIVTPIVHIDSYDHGNWSWLGFVPAYSARGDFYLRDLRKVRQYLSAQITYTTYEPRDRIHVLCGKFGYGIDYRRFTVQAGYLPAVNLSGGDVYHSLYVEMGYRFNTRKHNRQKALL